VTPPNPLPPTASQSAASPHDLALRHALEQQVSALIPIAADLHVAVVHPPVAPADWHGPASDAYASLEARMRSRVVEADRAVAATLQTSRIALGDLGA
jgi:hypothetical protein